MYIDDANQVCRAFHLSHSFSIKRNSVGDRWIVFQDLTFPCVYWSRLLQRLLLLWLSSPFPVFCPSILESQRLACLLCIRSVPWLFRFLTSVFNYCFLLLPLSNLVRVSTEIHSSWWCFLRPSISWHVEINVSLFPFDLFSMVVSSYFTEFSKVWNLLLIAILNSLSLLISRGNAVLNSRNAVCPMLL